MGWSNKYKKSIDCNNPKGFSQKAFVFGRKKRKESVMKLSELKSQIRLKINERSINVEELNKRIKSDIEKLDFYKKNKHTDKKDGLSKFLKN